MQGKHQHPWSCSASPVQMWHPLLSVKLPSHLLQEGTPELLPSGFAAQVEGREIVFPDQFVVHLQPFVEGHWSKVSLSPMQLY